MWLCFTSSVQHRLKTELFSVAMKHIYIDYDRSVCERPERERQEREDRNKVCPFARLLSTSLKPATLHNEC